MVPAAVPVNMPPAVMLAVPVPAVTDQVPPAVALVKEGVDDPTQTEAAPPPIAFTEGAGKTVKVPAEVAVPPAVTTVMVPVVPLPAVTTICVAVLETIELMGVPPMVTDVAPVKFVPVMVIDCVPAHPLAGVKEVMAGGKTQLTLLVLDMLDSPHEVVVCV